MCLREAGKEAGKRAEKKIPKREPANFPVARKASAEPACCSAWVGDLVALGDPVLQEFAPWAFEGPHRWLRRRPPRRYKRPPPWHR